MKIISIKIAVTIFEIENYSSGISENFLKKLFQNGNAQFLN